MERTTREKLRNLPDWFANKLCVFFTGEPLEFFVNWERINWITEKRKLQMNFSAVSRHLQQKKVDGFSLKYGVEYILTF